MKRLAIFYVFFALISFLSCDSGPKVIESEPVNASVDAAGTGIEAVPPADLAAPSSANETHEVVVKEVLHTPKYSYLSVSEDDGEAYWIAIPKSEVKVGDTYFYKGGLLKRNFFSKEYNRVFETVYLVSNIWQKSPEGGAVKEVLSQMETGKVPDLEVKDIKLAPGSTPLSELLENKAKYEGKVVKVTGKIVKVNPMIMNRNWLHIQDGTTEKDLTITTNENLPLGAIVSLEGTIALNKDFGAGYFYDIIMEGAVLK
ncbi:MAG: hypothetical protein D6714_03510 [Bacteroidetes bacterium]|nr:MAG: hypothetical protein D6714_03510 [Bacteroidota bacterium]